MSKQLDQSVISQELTKNGKVSRTITPTPLNLLYILENTGYKVDTSTLEKTDNSKDAGATIINTNFDTKNKRPRIIIGDNGCGMNESKLFKSMTLGGLISDEDYDKTSSDIGKYKAGLKNGELFLGCKTTLLTREDGGKLIKTYFSKKLMQKFADENGGQWGIHIYECNEDDKKIFEEYTNGGNHGTVIISEDITAFNDVQYWKSAMIKTFARTYHRFITEGLRIVVNGIIIEPVDICGYDIPFSLNGQTYESKICTDKVEWFDVPYIDKNGKLRKNGYLSYRSFFLPQTNECDDPAFTNEFGWNGYQQGIATYRCSRLIQSNNWYGITPANNTRLVRFKAETEFDGDLDGKENMGQTYRKDSVDPSQEINNRIEPFLRADIAKATKMFNDASGVNAKISGNLKQLAKKFSGWAKNQAHKLPTLKVPFDKKTKPNTKFTNRTKTCVKTGKKMKAIGDRLKIYFDDNINTGEFYICHQGQVHNSLEIYFNTGHDMFKRYVSSANVEQMAPIICMIWSEYYAWQRNVPMTNSKNVDEHYELRENIHREMGSWLEKMYKTTPKA